MCKDECWTDCRQCSERESDDSALFGQSTVRPFFGVLITPKFQSLKSERKNTEKRRTTESRRQRRRRKRNDSPFSPTGNFEIFHPSSTQIALFLNASFSAFWPAWLIGAITTIILTWKINLLSCLKTQNKSDFSSSMYSVSRYVSNLVPLANGVYSRNELTFYLKSIINRFGQ